MKKIAILLVFTLGTFIVPKIRKQSQWQSQLQ